MWKVVRGISVILKGINVLAICLAVIAGSTLALLPASISMKFVQQANEKREGV